MSRLPPILSSLALTLVAGCAPQAEFVSWDALEPAEARRALTEPTGEIATLDEAEIREAIAERLPVLLEEVRFLANSLEDLAGAVGAVGGEPGADGGAGTSSVQRNSSRGTSFFLSIGCPGDGGEPAKDSRHGELRLDSPRLDSIDPSALLDEGSVLLTFDDCDLGPVRIDGRAPAAFQIDPTLLGLPASDATSDAASRFTMALDLSDLEFSGATLPLGVIALQCDGVLNCGERQEVFAELVGGKLGSFVMRFGLFRDFWQTPVALSTEIVADNGALGCVFDPQQNSLDCDD